MDGQSLLQCLEITSQMSSRKKNSGAVFLKKKKDIKVLWHASSVFHGANVEWAKKDIDMVQMIQMIQMIQMNKDL